MEETSLRRQRLRSTAASGSGSWDASREYGTETLSVHSGVYPDPTTGAILTPIAQATTFVQSSIANYLEKGYSYTRSGNPTVTALEDRLAALEAGELEGAAATVYSTGMAATCTVLTTFLSAGDHAVITNCSYGGTNRACRMFLTRMGIEFSFVEMCDGEHLREVRAAIRPNTKLVFTETPMNPTLMLIDLEAVSKLCREHQLIHVCDNTLATPIILRPLDWGADVVLTSTTKFVDGHNITVGGSLVARNKELGDRLRLTQNILGNIMTPSTAFYQLQTCKTLSLRITKQSENAMAIATFLQSHPKVETVRYPGLASHPQRATAEKQHRNGLYGSMLWFEVRGEMEAGRRLMDTVSRPWSLCENLGATESILTCPSVMTHANMPREDRLKVGITDGFVRVSCGIEDAADLIHALSTALDAL